MSTRRGLDGAENLGTKWDAVVEQKLFAFYLSVTLVLHWHCLCDFHNWFGVNKYLVPQGISTPQLATCLVPVSKMICFSWWTISWWYSLFPVQAKSTRASGNGSRSTWLIYLSVSIIFDSQKHHQCSIAFSQKASSDIAVDANKSLPLALPATLCSYFLVSSQLKGSWLVVECYVMDNTFCGSVTAATQLRCDAEGGANGLEIKFARLSSC